MTGALRLVWLRVRNRENPAPAAYGLLDAAERARANRFRVERPRRVFVVARAALRSTLGAELGLDPRSLRFVTGRHGKPRLDLSTDLEFNLAHSGSTVVIALAHGAAVGVDVEELGRDLRASRLAHRFFTKAETAAVMAASVTLRLRVFYHLWTAKEAVLKATGSGLTVPVRTVEVEPNPDLPPRVHAMAGDSGAALEWRLHRHERPGEWMATIAHRGPRRDLVVTEVKSPD